MTRCVLLDVVGTLVRAREPVGATYARLASAEGAAVDSELLEQCFRTAFAAAPPLAGRPGDPSGRGWWREVVRNALSVAGVEVAAFDRYFERLYTHYAGAGAWEVYPEVPAALAALRARGLSLGVVSNFDARLPGLLAALGLAPFLDALTYSSEAGAAKPDPAIFARALRRHGVSAQEAVHVGDSLAADVEGARRSGLRALLLDRGGRRPDLPPGARRVGSLVEVPGRLEDWDAARHRGRL